MREIRRYLGLELAGAKNYKTALAALEFYPKEKKIFLLDIYDRIASHREEGDTEPHGHRTRSHSHGSGGSRPASGAAGSSGGVFGLTTNGDESLIELLEELTEDDPKNVLMGVNVPLELPPAIACARKGCKPSATATAAAKWMRETHRKAERQAKNDPQMPRLTEYTTYTQRPIELWIRYQVMSKLPLSHRFEIDETLGGNKAPLTARMQFVRRHLGSLSMIEAWPKLTVALLALSLDIPKRVIQTYRHLETGVHAREQIIETLTKSHDVFIYERDVRKLAQSLAAFDAFVCAYTALLSDTGACAKIPSGFPVASGWVQYPQC